MEYEAIVQKWRQRNLTEKEDLQRVLSQYAVDFAYHSGKIENDGICWRDVQQVFQTGQRHAPMPTRAPFWKFKTPKKPMLGCLTHGSKNAPSRKTL